MLDGLRCRQKSGVQCLRVGIIVHDLLAFVDDPFDGSHFLPRPALPSISKICSSRLSVSS